MKLTIDITKDVAVVQSDSRSNVMTDEEALGTYFKCFRGTNAHFAMSEPDSFALNDAAGRDWICYPVPTNVVESLDLLSDVADVDRADEKSDEHTVVRLVFCQTAQELSAYLANETPEVEEEDE